MSRTKKGSKAPGYEFWSKRAGNTTAMMYYGSGKKAKKITNKAERLKGKEEQRRCV